MVQETCFLLSGATKGWPKSQGTAREQSSKNHQIYRRKRKPSNIPQKKGNHQLAVSNCKFQNWELPPAGKRNAPYFCELDPSTRKAPAAPERAEFLQYELLHTLQSVRHPKKTYAFLSFFQKWGGECCPFLHFSGFRISTPPQVCARWSREPSGDVVMRDLLYILWIVTKGNVCFNQLSQAFISSAHDVTACFQVKCGLGSKVKC